MSADMSDGTRWFDKTPVVVALLVFFFPVGLYALWRNSRFSVKTKWAVTGVVGILACVGAIIDEPTAREPRSPEAALDGVTIENLEIGSRDGQRRAPVSMTITNTTENDIPGMQIAFVATDDRGQMGPFWLPPMGSESQLAVRAGKTRYVRLYIAGFGVRDMSDAKAVEIKILGANVQQTADRPKDERRSIFAERLACEDKADREASKKYPENFDLPAEQQVKRLKLRTAYAKPLREACQEEVRTKRQLTEEEERLISHEGILMGWPPLGNN